MLVGLKFWYCLVLEWQAPFCFTGDRGFLTLARKQLPEYSPDVRFSTHRHCCGCVSNTGERGLLWGPRRCSFARTVTGPAGVQGEMGVAGPFVLVQLPAQSFQGSHGDRLHLLLLCTGAPSAGCTQKLSPHRLLTWTEPRVALMYPRLEDVELPRLTCSVRLTAEWTWMVPTVNLHFLFYRMKV